jgi:hypothetical protein
LMWPKTRFAILAVMLIALVSLAPSTRANPGAHVAVPKSPLSIGQPAYITYPVSLIVSQAAVVSCPFASDPSFGDRIDHGFYVSSYPGSNLYTVHVQYDTKTAGTYTISMTANLGAFNGPIIGSTQTVTVDLTVDSWTDAIYNFGGALVATGSTIAFTQVIVNGPSGAFVFFNTGNGNMDNNPPGPTCSGLTETEDTTPPLSTQRRPSVGLEIAQLTPATATAPDFQIDVSPASQSVLQGQTVSYTVNVAALNGFSSRVSLTVTGAPFGANTVFSVPSATPDFVSALTVILPASAPAGSFTLVITGSGGGVSHLVNAVLIINQATQTQTSSSTEASGPSGASDLMTMLQQNYLLVIGALVLILVVAALVLRGQRKPSAGTTAQTTPTAYCPKCGTQNPTTNQFCGKCGAKLR